MRTKNLKVLRVPTTRFVKATDTQTSGNKTTLELKRTTSFKFKIIPDQERILSKFHQKGFLDYQNKPREKPSWSTLEDIQIVYKYNPILTGLATYYAYCDLNGTIHYARYILLYSCAKTLAQRHRKTVRQIFAKHGKDLTVIGPKNEEGRSKVTRIPTERFIISKLKLQNENTYRVFKPTFTKDPFAIQSSWRTKFKVYQHCCQCGSTDSIAMHHINSVKSIKKDTK